MRLAAIPQSLRESIGLAAGLVPTPLMDTLVALLLAKTVITGAAVGVFDALEAGALTAGEIAERCGSDPRATEKLVRALCACRYLKHRGNRFASAGVSRRWLSRKAPNSLHSAVLHSNLDLRFMDFEKYVMHGKSLEFHACLSAEEWRIYHEGQAGHSAQIIGEVIERISLPAHATELLDLGGGHGAYAIAFCRRYHGLRARVLDLATAVGEQEAKEASDGVRDRVQFEVQDIRTVPLRPDSNDVVLLANILHHFDDRTSRDLIERVGTALRPGGIAIVIDAIRPSSLRKTRQLEGLLDLYFGAASGVGLRTIEEIQGWIRNAGLAVLPPKRLRGMPVCWLQVGRKARQER
jgi:SAM-dependent methyltransferase